MIECTECEHYVDGCCKEFDIYVHKDTYEITCSKSEDSIPYDEIEDQE